MRRALAGILAAIACIGLSTPAVLGASFAQAVYADFRSDQAAGLVLVDRIQSDSARVTTALGKLQPNSTYRVIFSSDPCSTPLAHAPRLAFIRVDTTSLGDAFVTKIIGTDGGIWRETGSVRLMEEEGIYYFCTRARVVEHVDMPSDGNGSYARFQDNPHLGLTINTGSGNDQVSLRFALRGLQAGTRYRVVQSELTCQQWMSGMPDISQELTRFTADENGMKFLNRTETVAKDESITIGSIRIHRRHDGMLWECANVHPFYAAWLTVG
jgi:hypothetical protein